MEYIEINKGQIPYYFRIGLGKDAYEIHVNYNSVADLFTLGLHKEGKAICAGEPVIYGVPLWQGLSCYPGFPQVKLVAQDPSGQYDRVTYDNFGETVLLTVEEA